MLDCPVLQLNRMPIPEPVRYQNKGTQSSTGMLRYRNEMSRNGMPMPGNAKEHAKDRVIGQSDFCDWTMFTLLGLSELSALDRTGGKTCISNRQILYGYNGVVIFKQEYL